MTYDQQLTQDEQRTQDVETAHERMRGHVAEVRRLVEQGAPAHRFQPLLDQIEADLNTARPEHVGWANYQAPNQGVVTSTTGLSGVNEPVHYEGDSQPFTERDAEVREAGADDEGEQTQAPDNAPEV